MIVTVFGGSQPHRGEPAYQDALLLGRLLAQSGHAVVTGGYIGTMEAVSRGAFESGGHVIGVTCEEIEAWRANKPNPWVREERRCKTLRERIFTMIDLSEVALALPGGPGTLTEIALTWNLLLIEAIPPRPLILVGDSWKMVFESFYRELGAYVPERQRGFLNFVPDVNALSPMIKQW